MHDLKFALRQLLKNPGFTAVIVLSLALGIGATTTVFSWIQQVLLRPLPGVSKQEQMVVAVSNQGSGGVSLDDLRDLGALTNVFAGAAASQTTPASLTVDNRTEWIYGQVATANFFELLGIRPVRGRTFLPEEDRALGANPVLVISESFWQRRFGRDPSIVGRVVDLNRCRFTIVGVVPKAFRGTMTGLSCDFWAPVSMYHEVGSQQDFDLSSRSARGFHNLARLKPGVRLAQAQAAVDTLDAQLAAAFPRTNREVHHRVLPYSQCPYGAQRLMGPALWLLLAVSLGVLLIVAANVANLLLARASNRQKEIAIRLATGASRARLIRQLLTESLFLALLGGAAGTALAFWGVTLVTSFLPSTNLPVAHFGYRLDATTLAFTLLLTVTTGLVFGLVPALHASRPDLNEILKEGGRTSASGSTHRRWRQALVVVEIALALVLLVGAGLCFKGLQKARETDLGFDPDHVLTAGLQIGMHGYREATGRVFYRQLQQRLAATPGVEEATFASWLPLGLGGCKGHGVEAEGYQRPPGENPTFEYAIVAPGYFDTLRIPLVAGRDFNERDDTNAPMAAIVNEAFANHFWPGQNALGRKFRCAGQNRTVVGVTKTGKYNRLNEEPWCFFYLPYQQYVPDLDLNIVVRTRGDPGAFAGTLNEVVRALDPGVALWGSRPLTAHIAAAFFVQHLASTLLTFLGLIALALAAMGVYAVMAFTVTRRTQEFGVRMALGAQTADVLWAALRRELVPVGFGLGLGLVLALNATRLLAGFLYGVSPFDPLMFGGVPVLLACVALLACYLPARRATTVDPVVALRCE